MFGVHEDTNGTVDDKILIICNSYLKLQPPQALEDIEIAHQLGKPPVLPEEGRCEEGEGTDGPLTEPPKLRAIMVKFIAERKQLKSNPVKF